MQVNITAPIKKRLDVELSKDKILVDRLRNASITEINTLVNNMTNLAEARALFKQILLLISYVLNQK